MVILFPVSHCASLSYLLEPNQVDNRQGSPFRALLQKILRGSLHQPVEFCLTDLQAL